MNDTNRATTSDKRISLDARTFFPLVAAGTALILALGQHVGCSPKANPEGNLPTALETHESIDHTNTSAKKERDVSSDAVTDSSSCPIIVASDANASPKFNRDDALRSAQQSIQNQHWIEARSTLLKMLAADDTDLEAVLLMATVSAETGNRDQAIELLDEIPATQPRIAVHALGRAAELCVAAERYDDAVERYLSLIELVPTSALAHRRIAALLNGLGRRHEASRHVRLLCKLGNVQQEELHSLMVLSDACTEEPLGASGRARQMFSAQEFANAADEIRNNGVITAYPPAVQSLYGRCLAEMQDDERFQQWLSQIDDRTKKCAETWSAIGAWLANHQRFEEAIRALAEAIRLDPTDVRSYRRMHQSFVALDREQDAKTWEQRQAKLREVTLASNELGTTHQHDLMRYRRVVDGLNSLGRPLESVLWKAIASLHDNQSTEILSQLNETRVSLVESGRSFPTAEQRLCSLDIANYPDIDLESIASRSDANSQPEQSDWYKVEKVALPRFENIAASVGLTHAYQIASQPQDSHFMIHQSIGGGVAVIDFDLDGKCDLYFSQGAADPPKFTAELSNQMLRQVDGVLINVTELSGTTETRYSVGVTAGDWNQDGFPDIAISNIGTNSLLINNGDGTFQMEAIDASDRRTLLSTSIAIADLSGDGLPDIYQENYIDDPDIAAKPVVDEKGVLQIVAPADYQPASDEICYNERTGGRKCERVSEKDTDRRTGLGIVVSNFDSQPGNEIFVGNDVRPNQLWKRNADARWLDTAPTTGSALGFDGSLTASMGIATADFDRSGTPDFHVTNFENGPARLYLNRGGSFQDRAMSRNLSKDSYKVLGFGTQALDYNNDGFADLVVTNGHVENMDLATSPFKQPFQVFANMGSHFQIQPTLDTSTYLGSLHVGRGLARLDFNSDGKPDVVITHLGETSALLINRTETDHHWLQVHLVGIASERDAIGASITVTSGTQSWTGWALAGDGYLCRNEQVIAFGLGNVDQIDRVTVQWPDGAEVRYADVTVDKKWLIIQNEVNAFAMSD